MKRFLSTTAVVVALGMPAYAQTQLSTVEYNQADFFASDLIGMRIYNSETQYENDAMVPASAEQEWDDIGEINDLVVDESGSVRAVILGVGGFLGIGERDVAISMSDLKVVREEGDSGNRFLVVNTSKEMLEQQPEFDRSADETAMTASGDSTMSDQSNTASTDTASTDTATTEQSNMAATDTATTEQTDTASTDTATTEQTDTAATDTATTEQTDTAATDTATTEQTDTAEAEPMTEGTDTANAEAEPMTEGTDTASSDTTVEKTDTADVEVINETDTAAASGTSMEREPLMRPQVEREGYAEADMETVAAMTAEELDGAYVYGADDETVGEVGDLVMNEEGKITEVVINVGGFLGLGEKPVAVTFDELQILRSAEGNDFRIYIDSTEERLEALPEYKAD